MEYKVYIKAEIEFGESIEADNEEEALNIAMETINTNPEFYLDVKESKCTEVEEEE